MGIPYYFYVITKAYEGILLKRLPNHLKCHHFMLDYNGLIHPASQKFLKTVADKPTKDLEKGIMQSVWNDTQDLIKLVEPQNTVQIYIDGVAPVAKMNQQRKRRYLSILRKKLLGETSIWDSNAISPGTTFMTRLHASIRAHIRYSKESYEYYFSSSDEPGEGEHKLFERMVRLYSNPSEVKIIYGMDADLIMLSLLSHMPNIFLLRENQKVVGEYMYLHVDALRMGILKDLKYNYGWKFESQALEDVYGKTAQQVIESYIVVCFLMGNDFIPHPIGLDLKKGGLEDVLHQAGKLWNELEIPLVDVETSTIQWTFLSQLLEMLGMQENDKIFDIVANYWNRKVSYDTKEAEIDSYPHLHKDPLAYQMLFKIDRKKWRLYYYKHLFHSPMNDSRVIMSSCDLYLQGILWTYQYYKRQCKDSFWYYPYSYAPTMRDIANYLNGHMPEYEGLKGTWTEKHPKDVFCETGVQLLSILPKESAGCLPPKYQTQMLENPSLQYLYPSEYTLQTFMKNKLWECHPVLPPMNIPWVQQMLS